jgi:3-phosphoglycerate kinase
MTTSTEGDLYISTGGGAMIEYLMNDSLVGIEILG